MSEKPSKPLRIIFIAIIISYIIFRISEPFIAVSTSQRINKYLEIIFAGLIVLFLITKILGANEGKKEQNKNL